MAAQQRRGANQSYKLVLLGESAVGKSSFVLQFVKGQFDEWRESTIGAAFLTQSLTLDDGTTVNFELWDTAGQERFHSLAPMYYRNAAAAIVMYDVTSAASLERAKNWVRELQRQANSNTIVAFIGNKLDLVQEPSHRTREVSTEEAQEYAQDNGLLFFEASAKTGENIVHAFTEIAKKVSHQASLQSSSQSAQASGAQPRVNLYGQDQSSTNAGCNC